MKQNERDLSICPRMLNIHTLMTYTGLGRNKAMELGERANAKKNYGKRVLYDRLAIDKALDEL